MAMYKLLVSIIAITLSLAEISSNTHLSSKSNDETRRRLASRNPFTIIPFQSNQKFNIPRKFVHNCITINNLGNSKQYRWRIVKVDESINKRKKTGDTLRNTFFKKVIEKGRIKANKQETFPIEVNAGRNAEYALIKKVYYNDLRHLPRRLRRWVYICPITFAQATPQLVTTSKYILRIDAINSRQKEYTIIPKPIKVEGMFNAILPENKFLYAKDRAVGFTNDNQFVNLANVGLAEWTPIKGSEKWPNTDKQGIRLRCVGQSDSFLVFKDGELKVMQRAEIAQPAMRLASHWFWNDKRTRLYTKEK